MEQPWYTQYFWLLVFGGIILVTGIISFVMFCFCRTQFSRSLKLQIKRTSKEEKTQTRVQNVAVISDDLFYHSSASPTIILPEATNYKHDATALYATVKKEKVTFQQKGINSEYNGHKYHLQVPNKNYKYSSASYDSVLHSADFDYINTENSKNKGYKSDLRVPDKHDRYSYASYDSVGLSTDMNYINTDTENYTKDWEYVEVLADENDYDDVEII
ncbi:uncharacterized protein LOC130355757 [Hyla sarda]|uniref:uncharacterized protein LOC130355757 n=1 Tax=Hyla sarda TaxID=327740 RepID=UPI0024C2D5E3|nr:uncharacterized protein LOC130355757 [Hyla sarda]XP_056412343.1 uncharacterized protein LOC130355757 [Hyla sarda]XP_056412344.1 uncharacterized protein LOC130355757 [Hyla sarda]XP_056412345.1 uncharacterized protein LOC130355757 [Hyla sarda]XP_056412346.1 uncharacterized protein LOC130355757 [Hyla sarda]XP_056412347.1 uncharacterized protein LOC130355757 [Hyla sarda]XP_056412348.1 uncharacterized protein LOC130355757 [Hyla sarda]